MFLLQRVFWHGTVSAGQCWQPWAVGVQEVFGQWVCILGGWELDSVILVIPSNWGCSVNLYGAADWTNYCAIFFCFVFNSQGKKTAKGKILRRFQRAFKSPCSWTAASTQGTAAEVRGSSPATSRPNVALHPRVWCGQKGGAAGGAVGELFWPLPAPLGGASGAWNERSDVPGHRGSSVPAGGQREIERGENGEGSGSGLWWDWGSRCEGVNPAPALWLSPAGRSRGGSGCSGPALWPPLGALRSGCPRGLRPASGSTALATRWLRFACP